MCEPCVAVVIPTLDEEDRLPRTLSAIQGSGAPIVVSDGGSRDHSLEIAAGFGAHIVRADRGRGRQLNAGVAALPADGYLFLHADTIVPRGALDSVRQALRRGFAGGGFEVLFDSPKPLYRFGSAMVNMRTRRTKLALGDQAQFSSRSAFEAIGGFRDWPILEDLDFIRRLKRWGPLEVLSPPVRTSARRFERHGPVRGLARNWMIFILYALGVSPHRLMRLYPDGRP